MTDSLVMAQFLGGPMDGKCSELPINADGMPPCEIPCEVKDAGVLNFDTPVMEQLEKAVTTHRVLYVRTVSPLNEGPPVLYLAADPTDWDSHPDHA